MTVTPITTAARESGASLPSRALAPHLYLDPRLLALEQRHIF